MITNKTLRRMVIPQRYIAAGKFYRNIPGNIRQ
jgi:hypothetical protein